MASVKILQQAVFDGNYAQFWVEIAASNQNEIEKFTETTEIGKEFEDKIRIFSNLGFIPFGIAPNSDGLQDLKNHYASQGYNINVINYQDCIIQRNENRETNIFNSYKQRMREMFAKEYPQAIDAFNSMFLSKIRMQIEAVSNQLHQLGNLECMGIAEILLSLMTTISQYLLIPDDVDVEFAMRFICKGFIVGQVYDSAIIIYGLPGRSEYLENLVFGSPVRIAFKNLGCDVFVQHRNGNLSEVVFNTDEAVSLSLRSTDIVKLSFSNDVGYRKIENFEALIDVPCAIEIDFNRPKRTYSSSKSDESKRQQSRIQRIQVLFNQLTQTVSEKIISIDISNIAGAINSEIFQLFGKCANLKSLNLHNARISNADFKYIHPLVKLQSLDISGIQINSEGYNLFDLFPSLRVLTSAETPEIIKLLTKCEKLPPISKLYLSKNTINNETERILPKFESAYSLIVQNSDFITTNFKFLKQVPELRMLNLKDCQFSSHSLYCLVQNAMNVTSLEVSADKVDMSLSPEDFAPISSIKSLETLKIANRLISDQFIENLSLNAYKLSELDASFNMLTNFALTHLTRLKHLHTLKLTGCANINDTGIAALCESTLKLRKIDVRGTKITEYGLATLVNRFPNIKIDYSLN